MGRKFFPAIISLFIFLNLGTGCKKEEKATLTNQTVGQLVNQTVNQTAEKITNQTQTLNQTLKQPIEQPVKKIVNQTQTAVEKSGEKVSATLSCLKCHETLEKLTVSIKNSKVTSGQELAKYLKNISSHKNLHKNLKDEEIIKAFETVSKSSLQKKKIEGC